MNPEIGKLRMAYERRKGRLEQIESSTKVNEKKLKELEAALEATLKAQEIIHEVAHMTQDKLKFHISDLVSLALSSVFPYPYTFEVDFVSRRNRIEMDVYFKKNGVLMDPMAAAGGGAVDLGSLSLRPSIYSLIDRNRKPRPILFLDEPLKWLKGSDLPKKGSEMIRQFYTRLGIQVIMVSHDPELIDNADKVITVELKGEVSKLR